MKGLDSADRRLLKAILRGESSAAVGEMLGLRTPDAKRRMNGLVWELQRRAELAQALGVEPIFRSKSRNVARPRRCAHCEDPFTPRIGTRNQQYCSPECRKAQRDLREQERRAG
jgi:hypothetical protein